MPKCVCVQINQIRLVYRKKRADKQRSGDTARSPECTLELRDISSTSPPEAGRRPSASLLQVGANHHVVDPRRAKSQNDYYEMLSRSGKGHLSPMPHTNAYAMLNKHQNGHLSPMPHNNSYEMLSRPQYGHLRSMLHANSYTMLNRPQNGHLSPMPQNNAYDMLSQSENEYLTIVG